MGLIGSHWAVCPSLSNSLWLGVADAEWLKPSGGPLLYRYWKSDLPKPDIQSIGVQKEGERVLGSKGQMSILHSFLLLLRQVFNEMCSCACYAKIWGLRCGIIQWGSEKGYAVSCGGRKNCILMSFR